MVELLQDKDRIFQNLYGFNDWGLDSARDRGAWLGELGWVHLQF